MQKTAGDGRRPSPSKGELLAWRTFIETTERVRLTVGSRLQAESGLSTGDYVVLLALHEATDKRMRSSQLAEHIDWERSRLSHHLARMERRGLINRVECTTDSRGAEIVLTAVGSDRFRRASGPHLRAIQEIFVDALSPAQLQAVDDATRALRDHLDRVPDER